MTPLLWVDTETTGLDYDYDKLLEVGLILTDNELIEMARASWVFPFTKESKARLIPIIQEMHTASGLFEECYKTETSPALLQLQIATWIMENVPDYDNGDMKSKPPMAGSSVQFDRMMLLRNLPTVEGMFHYRNVDVSTLKETARRFAPNVYEEWEEIKADHGDKKHRVFDDILMSIKEYDFYLSAMRNGAWS